MCPSSTPAPERLGRRSEPARWSGSWRQPPDWRYPATRCCWLPAAPPRTCSATTANAATRSPPLYDDTWGTDRRRQVAVTTPSRTVTEEPRRVRGFVTWTRALRHALDRPLTSYYLLVSASALLLTIGLIMVLSASSVYSFRVYDDSYAIVEKQLLWVAIGIPCAWVASRLPLRWIRRLAYPGYAVSLTLLLLTAFLGVERNGNTNWLALGPIVIQPSEIAKLALILWAAHVYAHKDRRLRSLHETMFPVVPGMLVATGLVVLGRD